jgi:hypothetical protein
MPCGGNITRLTGRSMGAVTGPYGPSVLLLHQAGEGRVGRQDSCKGSSRTIV